MIEALREHTERELERFEKAILLLEKRTYQQKEDLESLIAKVDSILSRLDDLEDGQRPSMVDPQFEQRVIAAIEKRNKSTPPDVEIKSGDRSIKGGKAVVSWALLAGVLISLLWNAVGIIEAMRGK